MALDHLGFVVDAVFTGPPQLRAIRYRFENLEEQRKSITEMWGTQMVGEDDEVRAQLWRG
jgi:hypothetical protein